MKKWWKNGWTQLRISWNQKKCQITHWNSLPIHSWIHLVSIFALVLTQTIQLRVINAISHRPAYGDPALISPLGSFTFAILMFGSVSNWSPSYIKCLNMCSVLIYAGKLHSNASMTLLWAYECKYVYNLNVFTRLHRLIRLNLLLHLTSNSSIRAIPLKKRIVAKHSSCSDFMEHDMCISYVCAIVRKYYVHVFTINYV